MPAPPPANGPMVNAELDEKTLQEVAQEVFRDDRWEVALRNLGRRLRPEQAKRLLQDGAKTYGFWQLPDDALDGLVSQLLNREEMMSPGLQQWADSMEKNVTAVVPQSIKAPKSEATEKSQKTETSQVGEPVVQPMKTFATSRFSVDLVTLDAATSGETGVNVSRFIQEEQLPKARTVAMKPLSGLPDWKGHLVSPNYFRMINGSLHLVVLLCSAGYALDLVTSKYPLAIPLFSWPIFFARLGGMATAIWSALLFLSMCRSVLTVLSRCCPRRGASFWFTFLDCHKDLHIQAGKALVFYSAVHIGGHVIGTVPGVLQKNVSELNQLLGCAQEDPPYVADWDLSFFHWPHCPLSEEDKPMNFTEALFLTMPGFTGFLLVVVLAGLFLTSLQKFRTERFEVFSKIHSLGIFLWPPLLFLHGSQGWVGIGIPLVIVVCGLPILLYTLTRLARLLRYYLNARTVRILRAVVRPGQEEPVDGALVQLELSRPKCLWQWKRNAGMYAFICMPEYAPLQWHPMTITSGNEDETVNFLIAGIGDWTQELARRCLSGKLPRLALDGPFTAPTQSALEKRVLVAVGAGVGVTPFISLLSTLVAELVSESKQHRLVEAHFYWMTRDPMEFVFAWQILRKWLRQDILQSKIFVHLYTTARDPKQNLSAFLFKEAVKRQCLVDRRHFRSSLAQWLEQQEVQTPGPQFPWAWAEGGNEDLIWVKCPSFDSEGMASSFRTITDRGSADRLQPEVEGDPCDERMVPIWFGRPNFKRDISSIGKARPDMNVHVYVCGNDDLVRGLQSICDSCAQEALARSRTRKGPLQKYVVHYERFG
ncbi:Respiratory burst oxidase homolog protein F (Cytochrome b245 beta chain homolog RbohAp108) (NADPH oxidase RBOHF) (AtRBOHF) [Durusdinium trenchii]|uniref:Respiratory burst oxidase homolog protein F (Cytochrome b245 beta chain homolog RbohAp108) (NADPH oxidase RBOHF) (AtRBOHF) n=1 Tax=Durusdinium trenchii TaxID=1381693 RepID=A0ABP0RE92_9DINO